jgi:hypothetical protein
VHSILFPLSSSGVPKRGKRQLLRVRILSPFVGF